MGLNPWAGPLCLIGDLLDGDGLDLAEDALGQFLHGHAAAGGLGGEVLGVHLVEGGEVAHVRQEAGGLHHALEGDAGGLQNGAHVLAALVRLGGDALGDGAGGGIHGDLAGGDDQVAEGIALGIGPDGAGGVGGGDHGNRSLHGKTLL